MSRIERLLRAERRGPAANVGARVTADAQAGIQEVLGALPPGDRALGLARLEMNACSIAMTLAGRPGPLLVFARIGAGSVGPRVDCGTPGCGCPTVDCSVDVYGAPGDAVPDVIRAALARAPAGSLPPGAFASAAALWHENGAARVLIITAVPELAPRFALGPADYACVAV